MNMIGERKVLKSGIWYSISSFITSSIGFITVPIFTRILSKEEFGMYNNYTSWLSILTVIITLKLNASLMSARYDHKDDFDGYILSLVALNFLCVCFWGAIFNIWASFFINFTHLDLMYINAMLVYLTFTPIIEFFQGRERFLFKYKISACLSSLMAISSSLLAVLLVLNMNDKLAGRIWGVIIPAVIIGGIVGIFFLKKGKHIKLKYWLYAIPICLPYIPHNLAGNLLNSMDRVMIERYCGSEYTAIYSLAYNCGMIITLLISSLNMAIVPWLGEMLYHKKYEDIRCKTKKYILVFCVGAVLLMLIAPEILYIMGGEPYMAAKYVITPVAMGCVCQFLYTLYVNVEQFNKKTVGMAVATMCAALINYFLNVLFIPIYGFLAAAYTTLIGFFALLLLHMYLVERIGIKNLYNNKLVVMVVIVGIMIMMTITFLYEVNEIRYCFIVIYVLCMGGVILKKREEIKGMFK